MLKFMRSLFKPREIVPNPYAEPREFVVPEAGLRGEEQDNVLLVYHVLLSSALFGVSGMASVRPKVVRTERLGNQALVLSWGADLSITCMQVGQKGFGEISTLERAIRRKLPANRQSLEFVFQSGSDQVYYTAEFGPNVKIAHFEELTPHEVLFRNIPPVSQMVAFLRATLHQRRTTLKSMRGLARRCGNERVKSVVDYMVNHLGVNHDFSQPLVSKVHEALVAQGVQVCDHTLEGLCLLADVFLGRLDKAVVDAYCEDETPILISEEAASAAARFLGGESPVPALAQADLALHFLQQVALHRSLLTVLDDLSIDAGGVRSRQAIQTLVSNGVEEIGSDNGAQEALCLCLAAHGIKVKRQTVAGVCLYVDFETGIVSADDVAHLEPRQWASEHSLYALLSVARAFEVALDCIYMTSKDQSVIRDNVARILEQSVGGVIVRWCDVEGACPRTTFISEASALRKLVEAGAIFTGEVLCKWNSIDFLDSRDLEAFLQVGERLLCCFRAEDRSIRWRIVGGSGDKSIGKFPVELVGEHGFVERFRAYRFFGRVAGCYRAVTAADLVGRRSVVVVDLDSRSSRHYRYIPVVDCEATVLTPGNDDFKFGGECVEFPSLYGADLELVEPNSAYFLGIPEEKATETKRLSVLYQAVKACLASSSDKLSLAHEADLLEILRQALKRPSIRASLQDVMSFRTRCSIAALFGAPGQMPRGEILVSKSVAAALRDSRMVDSTVILVVYNLCQNLQLAFPAEHLEWDEERHGQLVEDGLRHMIQDESINVRITACALMNSVAIARNSTRREAASYLLSSLVEDSVCGSVASVSLAALALAPDLMPTALISVQNWEASLLAKGRDEEIVAEYEADIKRWLGESGTATALAARANLKGEADKIHVLAIFLNRFNRALAHGKARGIVRRCAVYAFNQGDAFRRRLVQSWDAFLKEKKLDIMKLSPAVIDGDFRAYVEKLSEEEGHGVLLFEIKLLDLPADGMLHIGDNDLFVAIASLVSPPDVARGQMPVPCLLSVGSGLNLAEPVDVGHCEVFYLDSGEWIPFLATAFVAKLRLASVSQRYYDELGNLYKAANEGKGYAYDLVQGTSRAGQEAGNSARPSAAGGQVGGTVAGPSDALGGIARADTLGELGERLARAFSLPPNTWGLALNILLSLNDEKLPPFHKKC